MKKIKKSTLTGDSSLQTATATTSLNPYEMDSSNSKLNSTPLDMMNTYHK